MRLVYLSPVFWSSYAQRPLFMVRHFLESGGKEVLWIDPYPGRLPKISDFQRRRGLHDQGTEIDPRIQVVNFTALPIEPLPGGFSFNKFLYGRQFFQEVESFSSRGDCAVGIGKPCCLALDILRSRQFRYAFYDAMDDFPAFHSGLSRKYMGRSEQAICDRVDEIFVSSTGLGNKINNSRAPVTRVFNACNPAKLPSPRQRRKKEPKVFGYVGSLGEWFDWDCLRSLARAAPSSEICLIGPQLMRLPRNLPQNVKIFPPCRQEDVGDILLGFDFGLIPFKKTTLTQSIDPIKFYEYKALGLPILSTSFGEMKLRKKEPGVFFLDDPLGVQVAVSAAATFQHDPDEVERWRSENSWTGRFKEARLFENVFSC